LNQLAFEPDALVIDEAHRLAQSFRSVLSTEITDWKLIRAMEAIEETSGETHRLPSGPLHDAAEVARAGVPTVMMFVQSLHGISHNKIEDTKEEHLELCVTAFDRLAEKAASRIANRTGQVDRQNSTADGRGFT